MDMVAMPAASFTAAAAASLRVMVLPATLATWSTEVTLPWSSSARCCTVRVVRSMPESTTAWGSSMRTFTGNLGSISWPWASVKVMSSAAKPS